MVEPQDWRVAIQLGEFKRYTLLFIGALILFSAWAAYELYTLRARMSVVADNVARIEGNLKEARNQTTHTKQILEIVERIDARQRLAPPKPALVSNSEAKYIRDWLRIPAFIPGVGKLNVGDMLPLGQTESFPDGLIAKLPKLKDLRFAIDSANNALALVEITAGRNLALL